MMTILLLISTVLVLSNAQSFIFPQEDDDTPVKIPQRIKNTKLPVYAPNICSTNELYYPGDQESDWVCDCGPGFIYYPTKDGCFAAYRQGPCAVNQYLILPKGKVIPECTINPCQTDGSVMYNGKCYELNKSGPPCKPVNQGGGIFGVNTTTLALECLQGEENLALIHFPPICRLGSKLGAICRPDYRRK